MMIMESLTELKLHLGLNIRKNIEKIIPLRIRYIMLNSIVIDDEPFCCEVLSTLLEKYCKDINVVAVCNSGTEALKVIHKLLPDLVFLDVEMPIMNGFDMLEQLPDIHFDLIFTTG